jgi:hypothetical protein
MMTETAAAKRQRMAEIIRALLAKTTAAGATEAEAASAAEKARELMDRYQLDLGTIGMEEEGTTTGEAGRRKRGRIWVSDYLAGAVGRYCDCKGWQSTRYNAAGYKDTVHKFFGLRSDVDFAAWLLDSLVSQITRSLTEALWQGQGRGWDFEKGFLLGAINRINARLDELAAARRAADNAARASGGRSLIVLKGAIVERDFRKLGLKLRSRSSSGMSAGSASGYAAGRAAGDRASFGRPVGGAGQLRIGKG